MKLCIYVVCSGNLYVTVCAIINYDRIMSLFSQVRLKQIGKISLRVVDVPGKIQTKYLPNKL